MFVVGLLRHMISAAHLISDQARHADGIFGGGDASFSVTCSGALIKRQ
jgi:hypothetical protein